MLPRLTQLEPVHRDIHAFAAALAAAGFRGDIQTDDATRLVTATDNSVYQLLPQAVVFPRDADDVSRCLRLLATPPFRALSLTARGGGTGTNGQSLTTGVVLDVSRHMRAIGAIHVEPGPDADDSAWVDVQPGVVLDDLNRAMAPYGRFFAPNLSPSSRATLGGMIATDASGKGSRVYGKTSEHILSLDVVLSDGTPFTFRPIEDRAELEALQARDDLVGAIHRAVDAILTVDTQVAAARFAVIRRFLSGYNLVHAQQRHQTGHPGRPWRLQLPYLLAGSEGTLAVVVGARLRLTRRPRAKALYAVKYPTFAAALDHAQELVASDPAAIETIDETVLGLARDDVIWRAVAPVLEDAPDEPHTAAINLIEYAGAEPDAVTAAAAALHDALTAGGYRFANARSDAEAAALWDLRSKGVGLLGATPGRRKPVAFVEDTVVPPRHLPAYVAEFRALLDAEGLRYGMFGHIDVGCLHVRPALDLTDPEDEARLRRVSDGVAALTRKYGGLLWGEHGKGFRGAYLPDTVGPELYTAMRRIKGAFDPDNRLNPGKLVTPLELDAPLEGDPAAGLLGIDAPLRGHLDRDIPRATRDAFLPAVECNGNGQCFNVDPDSVMCPSAKVTKDRIHSPKGRAGLMREWLRQTTAAGYDPATPPPAPSPLAALVAPFRAVARWARGRSGAYDYNREIYRAMDGCLACKACATQCPIRVDVPAFRASFLERYHTRYPRPAADGAIARLESTLPWLALTPRLSNALVLGNPVARWFQRRVVGLVDTPLLSRRPLRKLLADRQAKTATPEALAAADPTRAVVLLPDAFTSFFEADVAAACYDVLVALGCDVFVVPYFPNGKGLHVKGYLRRFERQVRRNVARLAPLAATGVPLVGIDPATTLTYADEYRHAAPDAPRFDVQLVQRFIAGALDRLPQRPALSDGPTRYHLFGHCTERTAAPAAIDDYRAVFAAFGLELAPRAVGCCGMCGAYGHEARHVAESAGIFDLSWARAIDALGEDERAHILADGHSCRSQVKRFRGFVPRHPLQVLAERLR